MAGIFTGVKNSMRIAQEEIFGGSKRGGLGRENGQEMIKEYLQTKSVWISTAKEVPNPFIRR